MEALHGFVNSVPEWHALLDNLNAKISQRQVELAALGEAQPLTRSLKKSGSTESLRPKDSEATFSPFSNPDSETTDPNRAIYPPTPPTSKDAGPLEAPNPSPLPMPLLHANTSPTPIQRRASSHHLPPILHMTLPTKSHISPQLLHKAPIRKGKTSSMISGESQAPKYRTRSMIIVYYDSAVQNAFEELVKYISSSRNNMRKGKMAARMAEMRRLAELEVENDEDEDEDEYSLVTPFTPTYRSSRSPRPLPLSMPSPTIDSTMPLKSEPATAPVQSTGLVADDDLDGDHQVQQLNYVSTRRMGPNRSGSSTAFASAPTTPSRRTPVMPNMRATLGARGSSGPQRASPRSGQSTIYDELDTGLEWCQSMCEHAAHQFLRDGECTVEIQGIKRRLDEVKQTAFVELIKVRDTPASQETATTSELVSNTRSSSRPQVYMSGQSREFREICMRKPAETVAKNQNQSQNQNQILEVDREAMDIDEGIEDMDDFKLNWVPTRRLY